MSETLEEIETRTAKYNKLVNEAKRVYEIPNCFLSGNNWFYSAEYYQEKFPGFPAEYYKIFEKFSNTNRSTKGSPNEIIDKLINNLSLD